MDFTGWEKINEDAYVYRGFFSDELCDLAFEHSKQAQEANSYEENPENKGILLLSVPMIKEIIDPVEKIFEGTKYIVDKFLHWYSVPKKSFGIHRDDEAYDSNPNKKAFGGVIYLSEMDGGILYYPESNTWMQPHKGDLVVQSSSVLHGAEYAEGYNKRTITFVVYDTTKEAEDLGKAWHKEFRDSTIKKCTEWLETDIGKRWHAEFYTWGVLDKKRYLWEKDVFLVHGFLTLEELEYFNEKNNNESKEIDVSIREKILERVGPLFDKKYKLYGFNEIEKVSVGENLEVQDITVIDNYCSLVMKIYLNDNFDGGDIFFPNIEKSWKPIKGSLICYPSDSQFSYGTNTVSVNNEYFISLYGKLLVD